MDKQIFALTIEHGLTTKPVQQFLYVGRFQDGLNRILFPDLRDPAMDCQQMQIMVAQHDHATSCEALEKTQHLQRMGAAVDQIADKPQPVRRRIESDAIQQFF